jgi:alkylation response protein AidB-like acyl-CoA dehydrogenase
MDFSYSEEQQAIRELAGQILEDQVSDDLLRDFDRGKREGARLIWPQLAEANLLGVSLPEDVGGMGLGIIELCQLFEQQGRTLAPVPLFSTLVLGALPIAAFGSEEQKQRLLAPVAAGSMILGGAFAEVGGPDPATPRTTASETSSGWRIDGEKVCVSFADEAHRILVPARTGEGQVGLCLVDPHADGAELEEQQGTNHEPQFTLRMTGVKVPSDDVLGDPRAGVPIVRFIQEHGRVALAAMQLGVCEEALRRTALYTTERKQFGRPIGSFQGVALRAADGYIDVDCMRSTLVQAAWQLAEGRETASEAVSVAKWWACRAGQRVVHTVQHLHGGIGSDIDYPIHRYFLWARHIELSLGGAQEMLAQIGTKIADGAEEMLA